MPSLSFADIQTQFNQSLGYIRNDITAIRQGTDTVNYTVALLIGCGCETLAAGIRKKVDARAAELVAEEMTMRELRKARKLTQVRVAKALGITQDVVSRLEKRGDLFLSTLRKTVRAMGGNLSLVAEFPDRPPVILSGVAAVETRSRPTPR